MFQHNSTPFHFKSFCFHFKTIRKTWKTCTVLEWTYSTITQPALLDTFSPTNDLCQVSRDGCRATAVGVSFPRSHLSSRCSLSFHRLLFFHWVRLRAVRADHKLTRSQGCDLAGWLWVADPAILAGFSRATTVGAFFKRKQTNQKRVYKCLPSNSCTRVT